MATQRQPYIQMISEGDVRELLYRVPWVLDGVCQLPEDLTRALIRESSQFNEWDLLPKFTLLCYIPLNFKANNIKEMVLSLFAQSYPNWQLTLLDPHDVLSNMNQLNLKNFSGEDRVKIVNGHKTKSKSQMLNSCIQETSSEFFIFLKPFCILHPQALSVIAKFIRLIPDSHFIYSNEAVINEAGRDILQFIRKPNFDFFTFLRIHYIGQLACVSQVLIRKVVEEEGFIFNPELGECEEYDLYLRLSQLSSFKPLHIPLFTCYQKDTIQKHLIKNIEGNSKIVINLLKKHLNILYGIDNYKISNFKTSFDGLPQTLSIHPLSPTTSLFKILVVVPFHNKSELTIACLNSLLSQTLLSFLNVVVIDNNSSSKEVEKIKLWLQKNTNLNAKVIAHSGPFNFARINNRAIDLYSIDNTNVLLLNNDVEIVSTHALEVMAAHLKAHKECAFVGIRLEYPNGQCVQHGGIKVVSGYAGSEYNNIGHASSRMEYVYEERISMGVTFACAMSRLDVFKELNGLEEYVLPNGFGDVDLCLKAREKGYVNHYYGTLWGIHHESKSRSSVCEDLEFAYFHARHGAAISYLRLRELSVIGSSPFPAKNNIGTLPLPLRYRLVDWLNSKIRRIPLLHKCLKWFVQTFGKFYSR